MTKALWVACSATVLWMSVAPADAQQPYPTRPVRMIVAFGAGGIADTIARTVGLKLADRFGQTVVVDNRPGAGGAVGARIAVQALADGHTLLVTTTAIAVNAAASTDAVDPRSRLVPIAVAASTPTIFVVHASTAAKGLMDFARGTKNGRFTFGSAGVGTTEHLTGEYVFRAIPGLDATHVPYQGGVAPVTAVLGQQVDMAATTPPTASTFIRQGSLKVLAVASRKRMGLLPDVPTLAEAGFPDFENRSWVAFFAPTRTPAAIVHQLNSEINAALRLPDVRDRLAALGFDPHAGSSAQFAEYLETEVGKWTQVIRTTGITPN